MAKAKKFGAISGVFTPSILTILGVIMYLRLPWIVGQAGLWATVGIIMVAHIISFTTSLSVASIATDKKVETGGSYFIISRSLGLPIGGTLGLALFVGLSFSVSLYLIGFAEVALGFFGFEATLNNIRLAGGLALLGITILTFISTSLAIKSQYIILTAMVLSLISVFFGSHEFDPSRPLIAPMEGALPWIALFAIFFPAVTGFEAGVSMSGDLKDPKKNIPAGTIGAVLVGLMVYLGLAFFLSHTVERDLLANDPGVLFQIAWIPQLVVAGIFGATLSSALGSILGAPRILQATAIDCITPAVFGKGYGAAKEPRNALLLTFVIAFAGIMIGELNVIARIVTIFFIITYGFLNITYAVESWAGTDFRPSFKIPGLISIIGALACIIVMIQLDVIAMLAASLVLIGLFLFLKRRELTLQTGDTWHSVWASLVKTGLVKLTAGNQRPLNWRPNVILFSGGAKQRPWLIDLGKALVGKLGIFTNFELIESRDEKHLFSKNQQIIAEELAGKTGVFTRRHICRDVYEGIESISRIYGFSGFEPNTILMGWPRNTRKPEAFQKLSRSFRKLDYNQIYLYYNKDKAFGKFKQIDIWWSGRGRNISFALALMRFLSSSQEWRQVSLRILAINTENSITDKYYDLLDQMLDNLRIRATVKVINNAVEQLPAKEIIQQESLNSDLVILELDDKQEDFFPQMNALVDALPSCLILKASQSFDELVVVTPQPMDDRIREPEKTPEPAFDLSAQIKPAQREIISAEVYKVARGLEQATQKFYNDSFVQIQQRNLAYQEELMELAEKTTEQLYQACKIEDVNSMNQELLRMLNDFSFQALRAMKNMRQDLLINHRQTLESSTRKYFVEIEKSLAALPIHIRVKYFWREFRTLRADSLATRLFKIWKLIMARITGKPAVYKIKVMRAARYYLYHKRLVAQQEVFRDFAKQSFDDIVSVRKILSDLYGLSEKTRTGITDREKLRYTIHMEKDRFKAAIELMQEGTVNFCHKAGARLEEALLDHLQLFSNLIDRPGSNFMTRSFPKACRNDAQLLDQINEFPELWQVNANLLANKIYLDFLMQSLKNRIEAKIGKYHADSKVILHSGLLKPIGELKKDLEGLAREGKTSQRPDKNLFKAIVVEDHYQGLYNEINSLFQELPVMLSIGGEDLAKQLEDQKFEQVREIVVSLRKTVEFSIASELIDFVKKQSLETSNALARSVTQIRDIVRLINFNLFDEASDEQTPEERQKLTEDFLSRLTQLENQIRQTVGSFEASFTKGLKNAFAPLSSGVIAKTSGAIARKYKAAENQKSWSQVQQWWRKAMGEVQQQFVNLIYTRSEGILWVGKMEKPTAHQELSNEEIYGFLDQFSPSPQIVNALPFYYSKLFSGQSGIGEDFWVGMEEELQHATTAINRFRNGNPGCLIITGERNSGKTSLSKYIARTHFEAGNIHNIIAPRECTAEVHLFEQYLLQSLASGRSDLDASLAALQQPTVVIVNDLELWWERKTGGTAVVERILQLVKQFRGKVLFMLNLNHHTLALLNQLTGLQSWALARIGCNGFDARELHNLIMLRHKAGGMKFVLNKKSENLLSAWEMARLFNRYFDVSGGNPGVTINLWLASITRVNGKILYMRKPPRPDLSFLDRLSREQAFFLIQFVYHLRLSVAGLTALLPGQHQEAGNHIQNLWQSGILVEKFPGVYAINPALQQPLVNKLREMNLL